MSCTSQRSFPLFFTSFHILAFIIFYSTFINVCLHFYCAHCVPVQRVYIYIYIYIYIYRVNQNYVNTDLKDRIRILLSSIPREMYARALNGTDARWLLCFKHDGEQVETVL